MRAGVEADVRLTQAGSPEERANHRHKVPAPARLGPGLDCGPATRSPQLSSLASSPAPHRSYRFGRFELQPEDRRLLADGAPVALGARAFDLLVALVARAGQLVSKSDLLTLVWPDLVVEENNLQVQISALRKLLGPQVIATIPGRGYRFMVELSGLVEPTPHVVPPGATEAKTQPHDVLTRLTNFPADLPPLYGRDADLTALRSLTDGHKLVTVVGAGGIGKSCLALAVAYSLTGRWPDGAWLVELAGVSDPGLVPNAVAQALHLTLPGQGSALDELVADLAPRTLLLVLDNCEHLLDAVAALVKAIMRQAPGVTLLTTSQEPLRLSAEQQYRVAPLDIPSESTTSGFRTFGAVALFEARVRAVDPNFTLSDESLSLVIDICRRLDGLPLAIELAAARVGTLGLRPARDKLDARFKLLTGGSRATLRRHQTLRATLEWSYNLLDDAEQAVFRRLGVFAGGFTMELAQAVAVDAQLDEWAVLDHLSALVEKSLVVAEPGDTPRYRLLESARAFALEQLAAGETADILKRHARAMRDFMQRVDGANLDCELRSDRYAALVLPELDNLRAAHAWATGESGDLNVAVAIAAHAGSLIDYTVECVDWLLPMLQHVEGGTVEPAVAARYWRAIAAYNMVGHVLRTLQVEAAVRALSMYRESGQPRRVASCLIQLARHRLAQRHTEAAQAAADEARGIIRHDWPAEFRILLLRVDGSLARLAGRRSDSVAIRRDTVRVSVSSGDWRHEVIDRSNLVDALWEAGSIVEAASEARKLNAELRVRPAANSDMAMQVANLIGILSEMGRIDEASAAAREAIPILRRARYTYIEEWVYFFWRRGQFDTAARLLGASDAERARFGTPHQPNEQRLIDEARAGLAARLPADTLTRGLAAGAALDEHDWLTVISEALAQSGENP